MNIILQFHFFRVSKVQMGWLTYHCCVCIKQVVFIASEELPWPGVGIDEMMKRGDLEHVMGGVYGDFFKSSVHLDRLMEWLDACFLKN